MTFDKSLILSHLFNRQLFSAHQVPGCEETDKRNLSKLKNLSHILMREKKRERGEKTFAIYHGKFWHHFCRKLHLFIYLEVNSEALM